MRGLNVFFMIGPFLAAGAALGSAIYNGVSQASANKKAFNNSVKLQQMQNDYNTNMYNTAVQNNRIDAEMSFDRQKQLIDYQNDVNSPSAQIARLRAAGLNPNLVYANGSLTNVATASSVPQASPASPAPASTDSFNNQSFQPVDFIQAASSAANIQYQAKMSRSVDLDNQRKALENFILSRTADSKIQGIKGENDAKWLLGDYQRQLLLNLQSSYDLNRQQYNFNNSMNPKLLQGQDRSNELVKFQSQIAHIDATMHQKLIASQVLAQYANIEYLQKQGVLATAQAKAALQNAAVSTQQALGMRYDNQFMYGDNPWYDSKQGKISWKNVGSTVMNALKMWIKH